jgi:drug/metabolite transporter (DMT)-like permease
MKQNKGMGHLTALLTIIVWGTTYISTKVLLRDFQPIEILLIRTVLGYILLWLVRPGKIKLQQNSHEWIMAGAGLSGICLYYLLENIALTYTLASNVGVIISAAPFFTALLSHLFLKEDGRLHLSFFVGFVFAMIGIAMMSFGGSEGMHLNPKGDLLALIAAFMWACYSILTKKISGYGYPTIQMTRHMFGYGVLFMLPAAVIFGFHPSLSALARPVNLLNILFLGVVASAVCFVTWNFAVKVLGAVRTSVYIYVTPVVTIITSVLILHEKITGVAVAGAGLALAGLILSEGKLDLKFMFTPKKLDDILKKLKFEKEE